MYTQKYFAIVVNGTERFFRTNPNDARRKAEHLREQHGPYGVWLRPHYRLMTADGSPVNL